MTTKLYMVRHCEALGNRQRLFQGTSDFDISETGEIQLKFLSERFSEIPVDRVYSSPLIRAYKTALAVVGNRSLNITKLDGLCELDGGIVEGKPFAESFKSIPGLADAWDNHPQDFHPEGGEAMRDAYERIWNTVLGIVRENPGKSIAAATHGGVTRCLMCRMLYNDINRLKEVPWCENTAISLIEFDEDFNPTLKFMNEHSHVPAEYMPKRNRLSSFAGGEK